MRFRRHPQKNHSLDSDEEQLVAEAEAFLNGHLTHYLSRNRQSIPAWAWLNRISHANLEEIRKIPINPLWCIELDAVSMIWRWHHVEQLLANDIVDIVRDNARFLSELQRDVLVPLERSLMFDRSSQLAPLEVVESTRAALRSYIASR